MGLLDVIGRSAGGYQHDPVTVKVEFGDQLQGDFAVFFGLLPGIFQPAKRIVNMAAALKAVEKKWLLSSLVCLIFFLLIVTWQIVFSNLNTFSAAASLGFG